jgi:hypothetical protein
MNTHQNSEDAILLSRARGELEAILNAEYENELRRRALLEKVLRRIIFQHKAKFPELKFTPVVKAWERITSQQW